MPFRRSKPLGPGAPCRASLGRKALWARSRAGRTARKDVPNAEATSSWKPGSPAGGDRLRSLKRYVRRGSSGETLKQPARDAGDPALRGDYARVNLTHNHTRLRGCRGPGVPRALVLRAQAGNAKLEYGLPGAAQRIRAMNHVCFSPACGAKAQLSAVLPPRWRPNAGIPAFLRCVVPDFLAISARFPGRGEAPSKRSSSTLLCRRERFFRLPYQNRS